jgi:uncharacterized protein DUF5681
MANPKGKGGFKPGQSGNPGGKPKGMAELQAMAREHGAASVKVLVEALKHKDSRIRILAAQTLLDRGYGKPQQSLEHTGNPGGAVLFQTIYERPHEGNRP